MSKQHIRTVICHLNDPRHIDFCFCIQIPFNFYFYLLTKRDDVVKIKFQRSLDSSLLFLDPEFTLTMRLFLFLLIHHRHLPFVKLQDHRSSSSLSTNTSKITLFKNQSPPLKNTSSSSLTHVRSLFHLFLTFYTI